MGDEGKLEKAREYASSVIVRSEDRTRNGLLVDGQALWLERAPTLELSKAQSADLEWAITSAYLRGEDPNDLDTSGAVECDAPDECGECEGCKQPMSWSPSGCYCGNQKCREFRD